MVEEHFGRMVGGADVRVLPPAGAMMWAALLMVAVMLAGMISIPAEVTVGVVTAAIGAPVFVWLLARSQQTDRLS